MDPILTPPLGWSPPYDDAYITLTSAQALWTGAIPGYPQTPILHGVTSPAHLVLVAGLVPVVDDPLTALWLSQVLGAILYVSGIRALCRSFSLSRLQSGPFVLIGVGVGMTPHHLFNGLETGLALGAVTWTLALANSRHWFAPVAFATLPFVRPEFALLTATLTVWWLTGLPRRDWIRCGVLMAIAGTPWLIFQLLQTGTIIPGTGPIKSAFLADGCWPISHKAFSMGIAVIRWTVALGPAALFCVGLGRRGLPLACAIAFGLALSGYAWGLPSHLPRYHHQRYMYGWLPAVLLGGVVLMTRYRVVGRFAVPLIALAVLVRMPSMWTTHRTWTDAFHTEQRALVSWLDKHLSASEPLMVIDAGYLAFATRHPLVDVVGLKTLSSVRQHAALTAPSCGARRGESLSAIALGTGARYFVPWGEWDQRLGLADQLRGAGWDLELIRTRPANAIDHWWYPVYKLTSGGRAR